MVDVVNPLGCSQVPDVLACMRKVPAETLLTFAMTIFPCIDYVQITATPYSLIKKGSYNKNVPVLIGNNKQEGEILIVDQLNSQGLNVWNVDQTIYNEQLGKVFANTQNVTNWYEKYAMSDGYWNTFAKIFSDFFIDCGSIMAADIISRTNPTFYYLFTHETLQWDWTSLGPSHSAELAYVFNNPLIQHHWWTEQEIVFANDICMFWDNFHRTGNPNPGVSNWPQYDSTAGRAQILGLNVTMTKIQRNDTTWAVCSNWEPLFL